MKDKDRKLYLSSITDKLVRGEMGRRDFLRLAGKLCLGAGAENAGQEGTRLGEETAEMVHRVAGDGAGELLTAQAADFLQCEAVESGVTQTKFQLNRLAAQCGEGLLPPHRMRQRIAAYRHALLRAEVFQWLARHIQHGNPEFAAHVRVYRQPVAFEHC